jgi:3',5'-cyclic AMP phosphodiesterase CpdA
MRLFAISDLHLSSLANLRALYEMPAFPNDWLIVAGDVAEKPDLAGEGLGLLAKRFARVIWTPGNHDLWTVPGPDGAGLRKYERLVAEARALGVITPEDPYPAWPGPPDCMIIAPVFTLYDYSFRPPDIAAEDVVAWAHEARSVCADEILLDPAPFPSRPAWCEQRCRLTEARLTALGGAPVIIVNHYPLRRQLVRIPRIPRFAPWCGTEATRDWPARFNIKIAISGHLHVRRTDWLDGTRFEEVSLGYPLQWDQRRGIAGYLRLILGQ